MNDNKPGTGGGRRRLGPAAVVVITGAAVLAAACGGSGRPSGSPAVAGAAAYQSALAYARCMRSHGEPGFPDPGSNGNFANLGPVDVHSPQYQSASRACGHLLPSYVVTPAQRKQGLRRALEFSACVRAHGIPSYRDPVELPNGNVELGGAPRPGSPPQLQAAARACRKYLPGAP